MVWEGAEIPSSSVIMPTRLHHDENCGYTPHSPCWYTDWPGGVRLQRARTHCQLWHLWGAHIYCTSRWLIVENCGRSNWKRKSSTLKSGSCPFSIPSIKHLKESTYRMRQEALQAEPTSCHTPCLVRQCHTSAEGNSVQVPLTAQLSRGKVHDDVVRAKPIWLYLILSVVLRTLDYIQWTSAAKLTFLWQWFSETV